MSPSKCLALLLAGGFIAAQAVAGPLPYDFKDPKGVNSASVHLDGDVEAINGYATGVSGIVTFDPEKPEATTGKITVDAKSLAFSNPMMTEHSHGAQWMDVAKYPTIEFTFKSIKKVDKKSDTLFVLTAVGDFLCHGVTKEMEVPVTVAYQKGRLAARFHNDQEGDLLVLKASFIVNRDVYGINAAMGQTVVAKDVEVSVAIVGANPTPVMKPPPPPAAPAPAAK